jgi:hypothetical protein
MQQVGGATADFVQGFVAEFEYVNNWWAPAAIRDMVAPKPGESPAVTLGRLSADTAVLIQAGGETIEGGSEITASLAACLATVEVGGVGCVAVPVGVATGSALIAHGGRTGIEAANAWNRDFGIWRSQVNSADSAPRPPQRTVATGKPGDVPGGRPEPIGSNMDAQNIKAVKRENESAQTLANAGYRVQQKPQPKPNGKRPDYLIEGEYWDCYAPSSSRARNIAEQIQTNKVDGGQATRIVLNLDDTTVTIADMRQQLTNYPIPSLDEVIAIKNGIIIHVYP